MLGRGIRGAVLEVVVLPELLTVVVVHDDEGAAPHAVEPVKEAPNFVRGVGDLSVVQVFDVGFALRGELAPFLHLVHLPAVERAREVGVGILDPEVPVTTWSTVEDVGVHDVQEQRRILVLGKIVPDSNTVLADEIDTVNPTTCQRAFPKILGRLRAGNVRQFAAASTPEGFRWMWKTFGSEDALQRDDRKLIRMRSVDNPHLPQDFIERLEANYDPSLLQAYLHGEFVNLNTGQVYDRFDRSKHVTSIIPDVSSEPLRIGVDFNIGNMSAVIGVRLGNKLVLIDEISGAHDTDALGQEIRRRFPDRRIYIYPDASGGSRSTNASRTDIQILESYGFSNQSPKANPPVRDRVAAVQAVLENGKGEVRVQIASSCKRTIECLELQSYTEKGDPDKEGGYDHMNDSLGYLIWREFNPLHARAGRGTGIRLY